MGTPAYMAPEQHLGQPTDERTDQFSFAISVFEALYGVRPFKGSSRQELQEAVCKHTIQPPPKTPHPPALYRVLKKAMSARPADRYTTMVLFLEDLEQAASSVPIWRRGAVFWLSLALVSMSGVAMVGWYNVSQSQSTPAITATTPSETSAKQEDDLSDLNLDDLDLSDLDLPELPKKLTAKEKKKMRTEAFAELHKDCLAEKDAFGVSCRTLSTWLSIAVIDLEYEGMGILGDDVFKASVRGLEPRFADLCNAPEPLVGSCAVAAIAYSYSKHDSETPEGSMIPKYDALMRRGCKHNDAMACLYMRNTYAAGGLDYKSNGSFTVPVSEKTFLGSVGGACEAGDGMACWWIGEVYWGSDYFKTKRKFRKASKYFEKSCEHGFNQGCLFAGLVRQPYTLKECQKVMQGIHKNISDNSVFDNTATWSDIEGFCGHAEKLRGKSADVAQRHWLRGCMHTHQEPNAFYNTMQRNAQAASCVLGEVSPYFEGEDR